MGGRCEEPGALCCCLDSGKPRLENLEDRKRYWCVSNPRAPQSSLPAVPKTNRKKQEQVLTSSASFRKALILSKLLYSSEGQKQNPQRQRAVIACSDPQPHREGSFGVTGTFRQKIRHFPGSVEAGLQRRDIFLRVINFPVPVTHTLGCSWPKRTLEPPRCRCGVGRAIPPHGGRGKHSAEPGGRRGITNIVRVLRELSRLYQACWLEGASTAASTPGRLQLSL